MKIVMTLEPKHFVTRLNRIEINFNDYSKLYRNNISVETPFGVYSHVFLFGIYSTFLCTVHSVALRFRW